MAIRLLVMDVDGTLTDGKIYIGSNGELFKAFSAKDGYGIHNIAASSGVTPVIITGRESEIVLKRCEEIGITKVYQGIDNKLEKLRAIAEKLSEVAYIGDDMNDFVCMKAVKEAGGMVGCPYDAVEKVKELVDFISTKNGGEGAVREFIDWLLESGSSC